MEGEWSGSVGEGEGRKNYMSIVSRFLLARVKCIQPRSRRNLSSKLNIFYFEPIERTVPMFAITRNGFAHRVQERSRKREEGGCKCWIFADKF